VVSPPPPPSTSTACDACGSSATYQESTSIDGSYVKRTITSSGCPNHYSYCTGKQGITGCGDIGEEGSGSEATAQDVVVEIPAYPVIASSKTSIECSVGSIAIALNGVAIYSGAVDNTCGLLDVDDSSGEWTSFDFCSGHSQQQGEYHYHFPPTCLLAQATANNSTSDGHSPQIGWSFDGFPIYGPLGPGGVMMTHTSEGCTGDYCLDECSGQMKELPALDGFMYRYYLSGETSDLFSLPGDPKPASSDYPFTMNCYIGCLWDDLSMGSCNGTSGVSANYTATPTTGYTTAYTDFSSDRQCGTKTPAGGSGNGSAGGGSPSPAVIGMIVAVCIGLFLIILSLSWFLCLKSKVVEVMDSRTA